MRGSTDLGFGSGLAPLGLGLALLGCQKLNPAFEEGADDVGSEADTRATGDGDNEPSSETSSSSNTDSDTNTDATDTNTDTDTDTGACSDAMLLCDGVCIDPESDPAHCGDCNIPCGEGHLCAHGSCSHIKRVFVTSVPLTSNLQGTGSANYYCNLSAENGELTGTFKAWSSTPNSWPDQSFSKTGIFVRTDNIVVAKNWDELLDGDLEAPMNVTEFGMVVEGAAACGLTTAVWTSTTVNGLSAGEPNCNGWTAADPSAAGQIGDANAVDGNWTLVDGCEISCATSLPIYCIEQ